MGGKGGYGSRTHQRTYTYRVNGDMQELAVTANEINAEYELARTSMVDSANRILNVGGMLIDVKKSLPHGEFILWVEANCNFTRFAAAKMMSGFSNVESTTHLDENTAAQISRQTWGNNGSVVEKYTGEDEWYTPAKVIDHVRNVLGTIDLDPASNAIANKTIGAKEYFTKKQDGLSKDWSGRVFLNPPYKQPLISEFTKKLVDSFVSGYVKQAILLTNNSTDTKWWQYASRNSSAACFTEGRISFYRDKEYNSPTNGQVFLYYGTNVDKFCQEFDETGWLSVPYF